MSLLVKSKEMNCRWCHKYALLQYTDPKREGSLPSYWKVRFTVQRRHPSLPCAALSVQSQPGTTIECCKGSAPKDLQFAGVASHHSFHNKSNPPNRQQGTMTRSISKGVPPILPRVRSLASMVLEVEGCQILWVLQYKQAALQATELQIASFLQTQVCLFVILLPSHSPHRHNSGSPVLPPPNWRKHLPQLMESCHTWVPPELPSHNEQWTVSQRECEGVPPTRFQFLRNCSNNYFWHFFFSSSDEIGQWLGSYQERRSNCRNFDSLPLTQCFWQSWSFTPLLWILVKANAKNTYSSPSLFQL